MRLSCSCTTTVAGARRCPFVKSATQLSPLQSLLVRAPLPCPLLSVKRRISSATRRLYHCCLFPCRLATPTQPPALLLLLPQQSPQNIDVIAAGQSFLHLHQQRCCCSALPPGSEPAAAISRCFLATTAPAPVVGHSSSSPLPCHYIVSPYRPSDVAFLNLCPTTLPPLLCRYIASPRRCPAATYSTLLPLPPHRAIEGCNQPQHSLLSQVVLIAGRANRPRSHQRVQQRRIVATATALDPTGMRSNERIAATTAVHRALPLLPSPPSSPTKPHMPLTLSPVIPVSSGRQPSLPHVVGRCLLLLPCHCILWLFPPSAAAPSCRHPSRSNQRQLLPPSAPSAVPAASSR
ncbi:hypothetical protein GW17_00043698 [Ensete ventricosum]|nr:hypothetical protein GW17_00043698 [Ensete ventricosum]